MHLKESDDNMNEVPGTNYSELNQNNTNPYGGNPGPYAGGQSPYGGAGGQSPYGGNGGAGGQSPYGGNGGAGGQSPYGGNGGAGGQGPYAGNPGMNGAYPAYGNNGAMNSPYSGAAVQKKSSFPVWLVVVIVLLIFGALLYFAGGKVLSIFGKSDYTPGVLSGSSFSNEYFGIKSNFGSGWKVTGYSGDAEAEKNALNSKQIISEVTAVNEQSAEVYMFAVEQTPYNVKEAGTDMDKLMEQLKQEFINQMQASSYSVSNIERDTMTIAGKTCEGIKMTGRMDGVDMDLSLVQFYMFKGNYVGMFTAVSTSQGKSKLVISNNVSSY